MLKIRQLLETEIDLLKDFPPEDWNLNLPELISFHFGYPYFYPVVALADNSIAGFGNGMLFGKTGWIGNILVTPEYRNRGIGYELTNHIVNYFYRNGCTSQILIASDMGRNIYSKIGFKVTSTYKFFKKDNFYTDHKKFRNIKEIKNKDIPLIKKFDREITGEDRFPLIARFLPTGYIIFSEKSDSIAGLYLPDLGSGLIIAKEQNAGIELVKFRLSQLIKTAVVPSENSVAIKFLENSGFINYMELPRMVLCDEADWKPKFVFNRAAGYCG